MTTSAPTNVKLFGRKIVVTIGTIQITDLAMKFEVSKSLKPEPNTCTVTVYNLNPDHRSALEQVKTATVLVEAGYQEGTSVLFVGDLRTGISPHVGTEWVTTVTSGDGEKAIKTARVSMSMKKGAATPDKVLQAIGQALGVGAGNLNQAVSTLKANGISNHFAQGAVISGSAFREMNAICRTCGLTWSIQNGKLQILPLGKALAGSALMISEQTGMVESPTVDNDGVLHCKTLLIPDVFPGRLMVIQAQRIKGNYRIETVKSSGDTWGQEWYHEIEAKRY